MNSITLDRIKPGAFTVSPDLSGDIWENTVIFKRGERVRIEASSGSGKTSLCNFIIGMRKDFSGSILFDETPTDTFSPSQWSMLRRDSLAWLPQDMGLFPQLTLRDNILLKNSLTESRTEIWIEQTCEMLGIKDCLDRQSSRMSIGQQQRGALVRALCQPFDFLLLDEPVSHLDDGWNAVVAELVDRELKKSGAGLILTSVGHHLDISIDTYLSL